MYDNTKRWPVVIMFHGGGGKARLALVETGWGRKAEEEGFLAVFPEGTSPDPSRPSRFSGNPQTWNDGSGRFGAVERNVDDIAFVRALLDDLAARFAVDSQRIYVTGFSNGAAMSFKIAREMAERVAAIAPVAGADWATDQPKPSRPIPVIYITGTADPLNPIDGGEVKLGRKDYGTKPPTREMLQKWAKAFGCQSEPETLRDADNVKAVAYCPEDRESEVIVYALEGHGHHWPGGKSFLPEAIAGKNVSNLNATDVIWEFFKTKSLSAASDTAY